MRLFCFLQSCVTANANSGLLIDNTARVRPCSPRPQNPQESHVYFAEGCHLCILRLHLRVAERMLCCGFRSKSATDTGVKSATDPDLISANPILNSATSQGVAPSLDQRSGAGPFCWSWGTMGGGADASRENVRCGRYARFYASIRGGRHQTSNRALDRRSAQHSRVHPRTGCRSSVGLATPDGRPRYGRS